MTAHNSFWAAGGSQGQPRSICSIFHQQELLTPTGFAFQLQKFTTSLQDFPRKICFVSCHEHFQDFLSPWDSCQDQQTRVCFFLGWITVWAAFSAGSLAKFFLGRIQAEKLPPKDLGRKLPRILPKIPVSETGILVGSWVAAMYFLWVSLFCMEFATNIHVHVAVKT